MIRRDPAQYSDTQRLVFRYAQRARYYHDNALRRHPTDRNRLMIVNIQVIAGIEISIEAEIADFQRISAVDEAISEQKE